MFTAESNSVNYPNLDFVIYSGDNNYTNKPSMDMDVRREIEDQKASMDIKVCTEIESNAQEILGFIIGRIMPAPEVYNLGGLTLMIDDFCVTSENLWHSVGAELIENIKDVAFRRDAVQIVVVCGSVDLPKRKFLMDQNLSVASEWFVGGIV